MSTIRLMVKVVVLCHQPGQLFPLTVPCRIVAGRLRFFALADLADQSPAQGADPLALQPVVGHLFHFGGHIGPPTRWSRFSGVMQFHLSSAGIPSPKPKGRPRCPD